MQIQLVKTFFSLYSIKIEIIYLRICAAFIFCNNRNDFKSGLILYFNIFIRELSTNLLPTRRWKKAAILKLNHAQDKNVILEQIFLRQEFCQNQFGHQNRMKINCVCPPKATLQIHSYKKMYSTKFFN